MPDKLTNIHEALQRAQISEKVALVNGTYKIHPTKKEIAEQICAKHGTTLSAFVRECVEGLVSDYCGEKTAQAISE